MCGFLCLWACWRDCRGQPILLLGVASSFIVLPSKRSLSFIHSVVSCPLFSCRLRLRPCCPASLFTPLPLSGLFISSTTDRSAFARSQHPVQSHNALACPCSMRQLRFPPLCVRSYGVPGIMTCGGGH